MPSSNSRVGVGGGSRPLKVGGISRRAVVKAGGTVLAGLLLPAAATRAAAPRRVDIHMRSDAIGARVWFDPVGLWVPPGTTVRWVLDANVHTTTAYHPANDHHPLRIPNRARPWDSGPLVNPGTWFSVTLTVEGIYDYYCTPHEIAGMVGRLVVGRPRGPGARRFDYFRGEAGTRQWTHVPEAARAAFPSIDAIMKERVVRVSPA